MAPGVVAINRILRLAARLRRGTEASAARFGLRAADMDILFVIDRLGVNGQVRVTDVAHILRVTPGGISKRLDGLEAAGYVVRGVYADDARAVSLALTDKAREVTLRARSRPHNLHALSEAEWAQLNELLTKLSQGWRETPRGEG